MSEMLSEIHQQPAVLERTIRAEWRHVERFKRLLQARPPRLIVLAARGTSDNAAEFGRYLLEIATGIPVSLSAPSIYTLYKAPVDLRHALVVAVSQSGESTDTNLVIEAARKAGSVTVGVTNERGSALANLAEHVFLVRGGRERSVAATKTYTGQLLIFYLLAYALGARIRETGLQRLPEWAAAALESEKAIAAVAERYRFMRQTVVVGRGLNMSNAFEFSLKLMETCYVVAERFSSADFLHGPIAIVEPSFPLFMFAPGGVTWPGAKEMLEKLRQLKAETLIFSDTGNREALAYPRCICLPLKFDSKGASPQDLFTPIPYIIPAQLFAAHLAKQKGINPDRPRTLSKVTKTI